MNRYYIEWMKKSDCFGLKGFGNVTAMNHWLGLSFLYGATVEFDTSLRIELTYCSPETTKTWTYPHFLLESSANDYVVMISQGGVGNASEGWRINPVFPNGVGPKFSTIDRYSAVVGNQSASCPSVYGNTGWWFTNSANNVCLPANLNGVRYDCGQSPPEEYSQIYWGRNDNGVPSNVHMKIRPFDMDNYDSTAWMVSAKMY